MLFCRVLGYSGLYPTDWTTLGISLYTQVLLCSSNGFRPLRKMNQEARLSHARSHVGFHEPAASQLLTNSPLSFSAGCFCVGQASAFGLRSLSSPRRPVFFLHPTSCGGLGIGIQLKCKAKSATTDAGFKDAAGADPFFFSLSVRWRPDGCRLGLQSLPAMASFLELPVVQQKGLLTPKSWFSPSP